MRASARFWTRFAACLLVAVAMPFSAADPSISITSEGCQDGWESSNAADSCGAAEETIGAWRVDTEAYIVWASGGACRVQVDCALSDNQQQPKENDVTTTLENIGWLVNCEGELKLHDC